MEIEKYIKDYPEIPVAVVWWASELTKFAKLSDDKYTDTFKNRWQQEITVCFTKKELESFQDKLAELLKEKILTKTVDYYNLYSPDYISIGVDYEPKDELNQALGVFTDKQIGYILPSKTIMNIQKGFISVKEGYGVKYKVLYNEKLYLKFFWKNKFKICKGKVPVYPGNYCTAKEYAEYSSIADPLGKQAADIRRKIVNLFNRQKIKYYSVQLKKYNNLEIVIPKSDYDVFRLGLKNLKENGLDQDNIFTDDYITSDYNLLGDDD